MTALPKHLLPLFSLFIIVNSFAQTGSYIKTSDGVIVYPDSDSRDIGKVKATRLQVISDNIIRVVASPEKEFPAVKSLMVNYRGKVVPQWDIVTNENPTKVAIKTKRISAVINFNSGQVEFYDSAGKKILGEKRFARRLT